MLGKPMVQWVYEQARKSRVLDDVFVTAPDAEIRDRLGLGSSFVLTSHSCRSGSDRVAEAANKLALHPGDTVVNIQGDEPMIRPEMIDALSWGICMTPKTLYYPCQNQKQYQDPNVVKVIVNPISREAAYFSRSPIPYVGPGKFARFNKHIGVYWYKVHMLNYWARMKPTPMEEMESLEQLRWLENGGTVYVVESPCDSVSVDTEEDLREAEEALRRQEYGH